MDEWLVVVGRGWSSGWSWLVVVGRVVGRGWSSGWSWLVVVGRGWSWLVVVSTSGVNRRTNQRQINGKSTANQRQIDVQTDGKPTANQRQINVTPTANRRQIDGKPTAAASECSLPAQGLGLRVTRDDVALWLCQSVIPRHLRVVRRRSGASTGQKMRGERVGCATGCVSVEPEQRVCAGPDAGNGTASRESGAWFLAWWRALMAVIVARGAAAAGQGRQANSG